jgi:hypothetical protein
LRLLAGLVRPFLLFRATRTAAKECRESSRC